MLCFILACSTISVHAYAPEEQHVISYQDGSFAEVNGTEEHVRNNKNFVIGSKTYTYYNLDGTTAFTYTVKASFTFDGTRADTTGCYTAFYVSDGWKKVEDNFGENSGTAVFANGSKRKTIQLSVSCSKNGKIS